jgi:DNA-binding HxlR family transcriptional regulator
MSKGSTKSFTPHKPTENSSMILEECDDLEKRVSQLKNQVNDMSDNMLKRVDFSHSEEILRREIEHKI